MLLEKACGASGKKKKKKKTMLKNVRVTEVSSVGRGASEGAYVSLFKMADPVGPVEKPKNEENEMDLEKKVSELEASNEALASQLAKSELMASFTDLQKAHYAGLKDSAKEDFEKASAEDREKAVSDAIAKAEAEDEVLKIQDKEIRKSAIGAEAFELLKVAESEKVRLLKEREAEKAVAVQKQAEEEAEKEFPHLGGSPVTKAKLLKAAREDKDLMEVLKSADAAIQGLTVEKGTSEGVEADSTDRFAEINKMATVLAEERKIPFIQAYDEVLKTKEGLALYERASR